MPTLRPHADPTTAVETLSDTAQRTRERVFLFLDERFGAGAGCTVDEYDSPAALREYAIDEVGCDEDLTEGCGVGPLMRHIDAWMTAFVAGERATPTDESFPLGIAFKPEALGFRLFRSRDSLLATFPLIHQEPSCYPVFAREEARFPATSTASACVVLSYLPLDHVKVVG